MLSYSLPFIAALTGWITNWIAIKMLFHPKKPINILGITIQGIFPKRQKALAMSIGGLVSKELFSIEDMKKGFQNPEHLEPVYAILDAKLDKFLKEKLPAAMPMLSMFMGDKAIGKVKEVLSKEFRESLPDMINTFTENMEKDMDIEKIVTEKVESFSLEKLEAVLYTIMSKEFKFIEVVGAVLGFLIGVIQVALVKLEAGSF